MSLVPPEVEVREDGRVSDLAPGERTLRVFEIASNTGDVGVDLSVSWAKHHESVVVAFHDSGRPLGWHAWLVGEDGDLLLSFPWHDHADKALGGPRLFQPSSWFSYDFPVQLTEKGWNELEQGWWGRVIPDGHLVFLAETDFDAIIDDPPGNVVCERPGRVLAGDVVILWSCTSREAYDRAWQQAIAACRTGRPAPIGELDHEALRVVFRS